MESQEASSKRLAIQLGFWSALLSALAFLVFTVCFVTIYFNPPLFIWTNLADYAAYATSHSSIFKDVAQLTMLLFGPLYVILVNSVHEITPVEKQPLTRLGLAFGSLFAVLISVNYFVQLSAVRLSVRQGQLAGIEQFVQANPYGGVAAINMLGWTIFLGLSSLFVAPAFSGSKLTAAIKVFFLLNGICCLIGGFAYVLEIVPVVYLTINFGMGGAVLILTILLAVLFRRMVAASRVATAH